MHKDSKCTFGILKGHLTILKIGILVYVVLKVDGVWKTCCSLHNQLLEIDGLTTEWVNSVHLIMSDWDGPMS